MKQPSKRASNKSTTTPWRPGCFGVLITAILVLGALPTSFAHARTSMTECLHAADADQRAEACTETLGEARDHDTQIRVLNARGLALCARADRCAEAIADFAAVVRMSPKIAGYWDNYARSLRAAKRYDDAIYASDTAINLAPGLAFIYFSKAKALELAGRFDDALRVLGQSMERAPDEAANWEFRGKLLGYLRRYPEAYAAYERALALQPKRFGVYVRRADTEWAQGRKEAAFADLERYPRDGSEADQVRAKIIALRQLPSDADIYPDENARLLDTSVGRKRSAAADQLKDGPAREPPATHQAPLSSGPAATAKGAKAESAAKAWSSTPDVSAALAAQTPDAACNVHDWTPVAQCVLEYHTENNSLPGGLPNPRRWNSALAAEGKAFAELHADVAWNHAKYNEIVVKAAEDAAAVSHRTDEKAEAPAATSKQATASQDESGSQTADIEAQVNLKGASITLGDVQCGSNLAVAALREYFAASNTGGGSQFTMFVPIDQNRLIVDRLVSFKDFITIKREPDALLCSATSLIGNTPSMAVRYELRVTDDKKSLIAREVQ